MLIGVLGGAVTASIISRFEDVLSSLLALASFTPVLAYLSDAVSWNSHTLGLIVGSAIFLSIIAAVAISTSLPFLLKRLTRIQPLQQGLLQL